ncbi:predicted protein [Plenodomus lingam JN3]|uniref:Predicted protein n=1 Tax=Leptosphaeria maculans (strain JN3 / isolate v23.1.3 / race Av1-4-5-6-7-8) TaxID=985895 RepID=E5AEQ4_LEPMJ|nr:predicted protein [Plenodomus lingam JN3]CBY01693.1 predicted protein [Plenodomus lingam JN3]
MHAEQERCEAVGYVLDLHSKNQVQRLLSPEHCLDQSNSPHLADASSKRAEAWQTALASPTLSRPHIR